MVRRPVAALVAVNRSKTSILSIRPSFSRYVRNIARVDGAGLSQCDMARGGQYLVVVDVGRRHVGVKSTFGHRTAAPSRFSTLRPPPAIRLAAKQLSSGKGESVQSPPAADDSRESHSHGDRTRDVEDGGAGHEPTPLSRPAANMMPEALADGRASPPNNIAAGSHSDRRENIAGEPGASKPTGAGHLYMEAAAAAAAAGSEKWFEDKYATTTKAAAVLLRNKIYGHLETGIKFFNEKSGWTEVEKLKNAISSLETRLRTSQDDFKRVRSELDDAQQAHREMQAT